jgi:signal transduction histidine kinase
MRRLIFYSVSFVLLLLISLMMDHRFNPESTRKVDPEAFRHTHLEKKSTLLQYMNGFRDSIQANGLDNLDPAFYCDYRKLFEDQGMAFFIYNGHDLRYWTVNNIPLPEMDTLKNETVTRLGNGWYSIRQMRTDSFRLMGVELIRKDYSYENQFLHNAFQEDYRLPSEVKIVKDRSLGTPINDENGDYLFSLYPSTYQQGKTFMYYLSISVFLLALVFLFLSIARFYKWLPAQRQRLTFTAIVAGGLVLIRWFMLWYQYPKNLYHLDAFDPTFYASSMINPNLGDMLFHLIFLWFVLWMVVRYFKTGQRKKKVSRSNAILESVAYSVLTMGFFSLLYYLFYSLIFNSSFSFDFYRFFELKPTGLLVLLTLFVLFALYFIWLDFFMNRIRPLLTFKWFWIIFLPLSVAFLLIASLKFDVSLRWYTILFFYLSHLIVSLVAYSDRQYTYPRLIAVILVSVFFSVYFIHTQTNHKEQDKRKILVSNLEGERDRIGELLLRRRESRIAEDSLIANWMVNHLDNEHKILDHLRSEYFSGFFAKYDVDIAVCAPWDDLTVIYDNKTEQHHCYSFFDQLIKDEGLPLQSSRFYYLDNLNGRISYIGIFTYHAGDPDLESILYLSLDSRLTESLLGYPELLLDKDFSGHGPLEDYSYAKYQFGQLIRRSGEYSYPMSLTQPFQTEGEDQFRSYNDYSHLIHQQDPETVIVISKPEKGFLDVLAQFSYFFAFFYLATLLFIFISGLPQNVTHFNYNFKNKIKLSIILILILSLLAVGFGTVYYTSRQFRQQHKENISEKMESLIVELEDKLGPEPFLTGDYQDYITHLLTKFSNVFYVDMNLYDLDGRLLASSRSQVFQKDLISTRMDPEAYYELAIEQQPQHIHDEKIGNMSYHSAYVPFYNDRKQKLAYLNIPYFTRQKALQKEIYTIVMVMINIYVFLIILGTVVAVLVSNTITKPLRLIREKIGHVGLDKTNEKIDYDSHDEIGELVSEYNRMLDELEANAGKLAQSEREMAWREMAKQIAHEIKNPLTPMKLKVQYLKRAWDDQVDNFDERIRQFADSMISQINTLSQIASEFSNFAKMPRARNVKLNLRSAIENTVHLFENTEGVEVRMKNHNQEDVTVYADPDQISRALSNLVKNAIQAIPSQRKGLIEIGLDSKDQKALVTVSDNGAGIPEQMNGKLFRPNFTTKSGGMGMGLAIVRKIIEDLGGSITFDTTPGEGTTFYIRLPLWEEQEEQ